MKVYTRQDKVWGTLRTDAPPSFTLNLCVVGAIVIGIASVSPLFFGIDMGMTLGIMLFGGVAVALLLYLRHRCYAAWEAFCEEMRLAEEKEKKAAQAAFEKAHPHHREEEFYQACVKAKIHNVTEPANIARLQLVAAKCDIQEPESKLIEMYRVGQDLKDAEKKASQLKKAMKAERSLATKSKQYIRYTGREKTIQMLEDEAKEYRKIIDQCQADRQTIRSGSDAMYELGKQQEQDWALLGGIASGLGGGAAGVATAIDTQVHNAQVRAHNDALLRDTTTMAFNLEMQVIDKENKAKEALEGYEKAIEAVQLKLVAELPEQELLQLLNPQATTQVSETGAVLITVKTQAVRNLKIYESVPAMVDGTLKVYVCCNDKKVGCAYATLPLTGSKHPCTIQTIAVDPAQKADKYQVVFEPHHLWAIEL